MNLAQALLALIDRPGDAMQAATQRPRSWWLPAALIVLSTAALLWVSQPYALKLARERSAQMIERIASRMSEQEAQTLRDNRRDMTPLQYWLAGGGAAVVMAGLGWVLRGAVAHFSSMAAGGRTSWGPTFAAGVWSMVPYAVRNAVQVVLVTARGAVLEHQGLSFLVASGDWLKDSRNLVYSLLANMDPFDLWHVILLAVGIAVATKLGRGKAFVLALIIWAAFLGLKLIPVAIGSALGGNLLG